MHRRVPSDSPRHLPHHLLRRVARFLPRAPAAPAPAARPAPVASQRAGGVARTAWWWRRRRAPPASASTSCEQGGNAVDAAVATGFALAVTYPRAGNIGGGGYMVIHLARRSIRHRDRLSRDRAGRDHARHVPRRATATPIPQKSRDSALAIGVPGTVAGLALAHEQYGSGKFTLAELIAPAIALARDGHPDRGRSRRFAAARAGAAGALAVHREDVPQADGARCSAGRHRWCSATSPRRSPRSPQTARAPSTKAPSPTQIAAAVHAAGGIMTRDDLKNYRPIERPPVRGSYRGHDIVVDAAVLVRRRDPDRDAQHPRRLSDLAAPTTQDACI